MEYNIQFQIAALVFNAVIMFLYLAKPKIHNTQNRIFFYQLLVSLLLVSCDIVSCIFLAKLDEYPEWNDVFGKGYIILMLFWLASIMDYLFATIRHDKMTRKTHRFLDFAKWALYVISATLTVVTLCIPEYYFHEGAVVYSYGIPSVCTYVYSFVLCVMLIVFVLLNWKYLIVRKKVSCLAFALASVVPAIIQFLFPEFLLLSLGCSVTELIMYMSLENPDLEYANRIEVLNSEKMDILGNIVPDYISEKMNYKLTPFYEELDEVCVAYIKIRNFSEMAAVKGLSQTVAILNKIYQAIDTILDNYGIEKVKISGDTYEVAIGLNGSHETDCQNMIAFINSVRTIISGISLGNEINIRSSYGVGFGSVAVCMMGSRRLSFDILSSTAEKTFLVAMESGDDGVLVTEDIKQRTSDVYNYQIHENNKLQEDLGNLYYLKIN